jgi:hypothetical protein
MRKTINLAPLLAIALIGCVATSAPPRPNHPIVGTWKFALADGKCFETYDFRPDGTRQVTSGEEALETAYEISDTPSPNDFYRFVDTVMKTNGKKDCSGELTPVGHVATSYVRVHPSGDTHIVCRSESLNYCFGPIRRVRGKDS